jgi:cathepsin A (carboxypeptidase C)
MLCDVSLILESFSRAMCVQRKMVGIGTTLVAIFLLSSTMAAPAGDKVKSWPGTNTTDLGFDLYSGFLPLNGTDGKEMHYVFATSQNNSSTDPVVLWLTGGPGCSSLEAFVYENGPYYFPQNQTYLVKNEYSWNKFANMLWFESPPGVGFSKTGSNPKNIYANDYTTADDNYNALKQFFVEFPEFKSHDFYISGESYGGIYVPFLATWVQKNTTRSDPRTEINLKGIVVGNGLVN